jgi:beta-glucosidase
VLVGTSVSDLPCRATVRLTGPIRVVGADRTLTTPITIERAETMTDDD